MQNSIFTRTSGRNNREMQIRDRTGATEGENQKQHTGSGRGGGSSYPGVLITEKELNISCILWMWYIFILTRILNSMTIKSYEY